jgi:hypothetical protein
MEDEHFRLRLLRAPAETLSAYALTVEVRQALINGDLRQVLRALGPNEGENKTEDAEGSGGTTSG